jgi:lysine-specific demethylase 3
MTSLFSSSWMCRLCGREACAECFAQVKELTVDRPGANQAEIAEIQAKREKHAHSNPFFLSCTRRNEHQAKDFSPMSRFCKKELSEAIEEMEKLLKDEEEKEKEIGAAARALPPATSHPSLPMLRDTNNPTDLLRSSQALLADLDPYSLIRDKLPPHDLDQPYIPKDLSHRTVTVPTRKIHRFSDSVLTPEVFADVWALGLPLVVTDVLSKFKIKWTPEYFIQKYGTQSCLIIECQTEVNKRVTVGEFFSWFGKYEGRENCWKLKVIFFYFVFCYEQRLRSCGIGRIGLLRKTSKPRSQNCTRISAELCLSPIMCERMVFSTWDPTSPLTPSLQILVSFFPTFSSSLVLLTSSQVRRCTIPWRRPK